MAAPSIIDNVINITRTFSAAPSKVFKLWNDPKLVAKWFSPCPESTATVESLDVRPGGRYRVVIKNGKGEEKIIGGFYEVADKDSRLEFIWGWEKPEELYFGDNRVIVEFSGKDGGTELKLNHGRFPERSQVESHEEGWNNMLDQLAKLL